MTVLRHEFNAYGMTVSRHEFHACDVCDVMRNARPAQQCAMRLERGVHADGQLHGDTQQACDETWINRLCM